MATSSTADPASTPAETPGATPTSVGKGIRITGATRETLTGQVRQRYEKGEPIREIAASLGRSYGFIHRLLREGEVPLRARGGATRGRGAAPDPSAGRTAPT